MSHLPDIDQLEAFVRVASSLHFGRAAEELHLTQSSVSYRVRRLEEALGVILLERDTRHVRLTSAGSAFLRRARAILRELADAAQEVQEAGARQRWVMGYAGIATASPLVEAAAMLLERFPALRIVLRQAPLAEQLRGLTGGEWDVASSFLPPPALPEGIETVATVRAPLFAWLAEEHPLARRRALTLAQLRGQRWVTLAPGAEPGFEGFVDTWGGAGALESVAVDSLDATLDLVRRGAAVAVLPSLSVGCEGVRRVPLRDGPVSTTRVFVRRKDRGPVAEALRATWSKPTRAAGR